MSSDPEQALIDKIEELRAELAAYEQALAALPQRSRAGTTPAPRRRRQSRTDRILELLADAGEDGMTRADLATQLGLIGDEDLLSSALSHLKRTDRIRRTDDGRWTLPA